MESFWDKILVGLVVGFGTATITVFLAYGRFQHEALWNKKLESYLAILRALHAVRNIMEMFHHRYAEQRDQGVYQVDPHERFPEDTFPTLESAQKDLRAAVEVGELIISVEAVRRLRRIRNDLPDQTELLPSPKEYSEYYSGVELIYAEAATDLLDLARKDLRAVYGLRKKWKELFSQYEI